MGFFPQLSFITIPKLPDSITVKIEILKQKITKFITSGITVNLLLPLINGIFLGLGEILAKEFYFSYVGKAIVQRRVSKY
ncbi:hypothetical protein QEN19_004105 [Hanseniaspora menglaensis]